jgi:hypothetical protein
MFKSVSLHLSSLQHPHFTRPLHVHVTLPFLFSAPLLYPFSSCPRHFTLHLQCTSTLPVLFMSTSLYPSSSVHLHFTRSLHVHLTLLSPHLHAVFYFAHASRLVSTLNLLSYPSRPVPVAATSVCGTERLSRRIRQESYLCGSHLCVYLPRRALH